MLLRKKLFSTVIIVAILTIQLLFYFATVVYAESEIAFTPEVIFEIPSKNGSIRFSSNGTYETAFLENETWIFKRLYLSNSIGNEKLNITISASDCDLTITSYRITPYTYGSATLKWVILRYNVSGHGTQIINLGLDPKNGQLDVILDGEYIGRNHGWTVSKDGTLTITKPNSDVRLWYIGYPEVPENVTFLNQHSVLIGSLSIFSIIIIIAITFRNKKGSELTTTKHRNNLKL